MAAFEGAEGSHQSDPIGTTGVLSQGAFWRSRRRGQGPTAYRSADLRSRVQGQSCADVAKDDANLKPSSTTTAQGGNALVAFGLNATFALDSTASAYFGFLTNAMGVSPSYMKPIPTNRGFTGSLATGAVFLGTMMIGPGSGAGRVIRILEQSSGVVHVEVKTAQGVYEIMANVRREGSTLILDKAHIEGGGAGQFGTGMLREIREAARQFGREQGVSEVIVNPGVRTSGANPGHSMRSFRIEVK